MGEDNDRQLESLWRETNMDIVDEAARILVISKGGRNAAKEGHDAEEPENDQETGCNRHIQRSHLWTKEA